MGCHHVRCSKPFLKWTREEFKQMNKRTRKLMTMHKALHPSDYVDRLYVSRKEGRRLACIEIASMLPRKLKDYTEQSRGRLIRATRNDTDNTWIKRRKITRKQKSEITNVWIFQATNKWNLTQDNLDMPQKGKPKERNWISSHSNREPRHKD